LIIDQILRIKKAPKLCFGAFYSDTAIFVFLPALVIELIAPAAEKYVCY